jgi:hypothetical protein
MKVYMYRMTLQHDKGLVRITTAATSIQAAIDTVCRAEGCPECAVVRVEFLGDVV